MHLSSDWTVSETCVGGAIVSVAVAQQVNGALQQCVATRGRQWVK